jgi:hypothetical protein
MQVQSHELGAEWQLRGGAVNISIERVLCCAPLKQGAAPRFLTTDVTHPCHPFTIPELVVFLRA